MTADNYLNQIISRHYVPAATDSTGQTTAQSLLPLIQEWAGTYLLNVYYSGSFAKDTRIVGATDLDLLVSIDYSVNRTVKELYGLLFDFLQGKKLTVSKQNVSIGLRYGSAKVDLVPGRKQAGNTNDHTIYRRKADTWSQTNINDQISHVKNSGRLNEIRLAKTWRKLHQLDFPSFYLELTVINALSGARTSQLANNFWTVLGFLKDNFAAARVVDPANSNNTISSDLTLAEKKVIAQAAASSRTKKELGRNRVVIS